MSREERVGTTHQSSDENVHECIMDDIVRTSVPYHLCVYAHFDKAREIEGFWKVGLLQK